MRNVKGTGYCQIGLRAIFPRTKREISSRCGIRARVHCRTSHGVTAMKLPRELVQLVTENQGGRPALWSQV